MPRFARIVLVDEPYHVTHRGNRRADVFHSEEDREVYLAVLAQACTRFRLDVWAWCLMTNHIHLLAVPRSRAAMAGGVGRAHMRYSRWMNKQQGWTGHSWANRFHSSLLDEEHLWNAVKYIEQNPVRAGLVAHCEEWPWSSARSHCGLLGNAVDPLLSSARSFPGQISNWSAWVNVAVGAEFCDQIRRNTATGRPTASDNVVRRVEALLARTVAPVRKRGRPRKAAVDNDPSDDFFA